MGKFKTIFVTCLGLGLAAGAGYYLYKRFVRKEGEEEEGDGNSSTQNGVENVENKNEDLDKNPKGQESNKILAHVADGKTEEKDPKGHENKEIMASVADTSTQDDSNVKGASKAVEKESSLQPNGINGQKGQTVVKKRKKGNFGGFKKGFLL